MTDVLERLRARDTSLWPAGNVAAERLGWLDVARTMEGQAADLVRWAATIDAARVVLLGMGGSSLGAEVLRDAFGDHRLLVCDTTDPATVAAIPLADAFYLVSSKSGTTLEPNVLLAHVWDAVPHGSRYAAITDPGTPLADLARERGFNRVFENPPDIGGRYSVLSYFGMVPAALMGIDVARLCEAASTMNAEEAVALGLAMGRAALDARDKVTVVVPDRFAAFGLWVEQLIAESTGKQGKGCVPVPTTEVERGEDRHLVLLALEDPYDLGRELQRWELATAAAGHALGIDPFDEPNVAESKANTETVLEDLPLTATPSADPASVSTWLRANARPGRDYVALQAYLPFGWARPEAGRVCDPSALEGLRRAVRDGLDGMAVTAGYGPRFLHSTGQLHKGGPDEVVAVQIVPRHPSARVRVPGRDYDFATLLDAQALGDLESLRAHGRRVLRVEVDDLNEVK